METPNKLENSEQNLSTVNNSFNSFYQYTPNTNPHNNINEYNNNNEFKYREFINSIKKDDKEFTFKKVNKIRQNKSKNKSKKITFKKEGKKFTFNKYNDSDIGFNTDIMEELIEYSEFGSKVKNITHTEEDFSSDEEQIKVAQLKCKKDLDDALDLLDNGKIEKLFYICVLQNLIL